jgi:hypothetical protein
VNYLPRLAWNHDPPDLCLLSRQDYGHCAGEFLDSFPQFGLFFFFLNFSASFFLFSHSGTSAPCARLLTSVAQVTEALIIFST